MTTTSTPLMILRSQMVFAVLDALQSGEIRYLILRNYQNAFLDESGDCDILIDGGQATEASEQVRSALAQFCSFTDIYRNPKKTVICGLHADPATGDVSYPLGVVKFELHHYVTFKQSSIDRLLPGGGRLLAYHDIPTKSWKFPGGAVHPVPTRASEALLLLIQYSINGKDKYRDRAIELLQGIAGTGFREVVKRLQSFAEAASESGWREALTPIMVQLSPLALQGSSSGYARRRVAVYWRWLGDRIRRIRSSRVTFFSGPDGSGKSTTCLTFLQWNRMMGRPIQALQTLQVGLSLVLDLVNRRKPGNQSRVGKLGTSKIPRDRDSGTLTWRFRRKAGLLVGLVDMCIFGRLNLWYCLLRGREVVAETGPWDIFVKRHRPRSILMEHVFAFLLPRADKIYFCRAEPAIIHARKPELTEEELTTYYRVMEGLYREKCSSRVVPLRTDGRFSETVIPLLSSSIGHSAD